MGINDNKPCPFCGSKDLKWGGDDKIVKVWCNNRDAYGPNHYGGFDWNDRAVESNRIEELEAKLAKIEEAGMEATASLNAAISLIENGGKGAAWSDNVFRQMLQDYKNSVENFKRITGEPSDEKVDGTVR